MTISRNANSPLRRHCEAREKACFLINDLVAEANSWHDIINKRLLCRYEISQIDEIIEAPYNDVLLKWFIINLLRFAKRIHTFVLPY